MIRKIIPVFTAAAISMGITFVVPVAITAVSSFTFVTEAQAFGYKSFKKSIKKTVKKTKRMVKKKAKSKIDEVLMAGEALKSFSDSYIKPGSKSFIRDTKGAGRIALGTAKAAGRTIDRRSSKACVALGGCQGTITRGVSPGTKVTYNRL
jgi:hypothetical protein